MSEENKPKTAADIERELLAAREKELEEETPEPEMTDEVPEPEVDEETPEEPEEVPAQQNTKTAAEIERDMLTARQNEPKEKIINTDEQRPLTAAERERALLKARQAEVDETAEQEENKGKPRSKLGIHNLKKTWKGRLLLVGGLLILILAVTFYNFPNLLRSMFSGKEQTEQVDAAGTSSGKSHRLTDLNKDNAFDTADARDAATNGSQRDTTGKQGKQAESAPSPVTFSRALAQGISVSSSTGSSNQTENNASNSGSDDNRTGTPSQGEGGEDGKNGLNAIKILPYDPNLFIPENTAIPCSLDRRFVSDLSGKLTCTINDDIYSANGNVKLIEKGTRASLVYKMGMLKHGQGRAFLMATKLRTRKQPFMDIPLIDSEAAGALGEAGIDGWIDTHFWERFGGAMMLGMIPDAMQGVSQAAKNNKDNQSDYTANSREAFAEIAKEAFANSVNIPPTMYKNQGEIITLITGQDLDFSSVYRLKMRK